MERAPWDVSKILKEKHVKNVPQENMVLTVTTLVQQTVNFKNVFAKTELVSEGVHRPITQEVNVIFVFQENTG